MKILKAKVRKQHFILFLNAVISNVECMTTHAHPFRPFPISLQATWIKLKVRMLQVKGGYPCSHCLCHIEAASFNPELVWVILYNMDTHLKLSTQLHVKIFYSSM